jgi:hypothetical protein
LDTDHEQRGLGLIIRILSCVYTYLQASQVGTSTEYLAVTLTLTYEDGSSSARTTYFVYQNGEWKHRFGQEEQDLFMPDATTRNSSRLNSRGCGVEGFWCHLGGLVLGA